ncbi:MAG: selenocysteine-specific translation elongation factor [Chitinivibrionales bacterium]|nr:selenocysteine-specific translation elongation factor [Chitinivibrionales bacterium]
MSEQFSHHVVLGMAGHIDHGKTSLVKALTGTDTDRLKEEKERGMTTDLGFAFLGNDITVIDVPGHEKFVKTMVAGVNTVDIALLVIAADDGIMPQTVEHLEILNLLQIGKGIIAVNKSDLVAPDWLQLVIEDIKAMCVGTVLENAPIHAVSTITGMGIEELKSEIHAVAHEVRQRKDKGIFRLLIDRVFTIKGFGTVVAGTVLSGKISPDDTVELLPHKKLLRVRGVQIHDQAVHECRVGSRAAINVGGIDKESIERGDVLVEPGFFTPSHMVDASFTYLKSATKELKNRSRIRLHIGTTEVIGRIVLLDKKECKPADSGFIQIHVEKPIVTDVGDRFVIRSYSPLRTIGGGMILDANAQRHKPMQEETIAHLQRLYNGDPNQVIIEFLDKNRFIPQAIDDIAKSCGMNKEEVNQRTEALVAVGSLMRIGKKRVMTSQNHKGLQIRIQTLLESFHEENPLNFSIPAAKLCQMVRTPVDRLLFEEIIADCRQKGVVIVDADQVRLASHHITLPPKMVEYKQQIEDAFLKEQFNPPKYDDIIEQMGDKVKKLFQYMVDTAELVQVEKGSYFHSRAITKAQELLVQAFSIKASLGLGDVRDVLGMTSRAKVVMLMEYFDRIGFTQRAGDVRIMKKQMESETGKTLI